jgi:hypothetical protein
MKERIAKLLAVKSIVTIMLTVVFCMMTVRGSVSGEQFLTIFTVVIGFYFGTQHERKVGHETTADATAVPETKAE